MSEFNGFGKNSGAAVVLGHVLITNKTGFNGYISPENDRHAKAIAAVINNPRYAELVMNTITEATFDDMPVINTVSLVEYVDNIGRLNE